MNEMHFDPGQDVYNINSEFFNGPFDLLLHLIRKNKMNIMDIRISDITSEYLKYLEAGEGINPVREGDFLMTASTLIYIKSRSLLPRTEQEGQESPEKKLINTLIEFDKIRKISILLKEMEKREIMLWKREDITENFENREYDLEEVSSFQLAEIFLNIVNRDDGKDVLFLDKKSYSVEKVRNLILGKLDSEGFINFNKYAETLDSVEEILVSFFTILEMVKRKSIIAVQKGLFDTISIWKHEKGEISN
ncbi:MAG: segregation/condensation protein A [Acidobacteriota bacterium]